jgi:exopolyphosphatase/guanosine-5'-triphosphate,3'-diphosphate pyrophosphatase
MIPANPDIPEKWQDDPAIRQVLAFMNRYDPDHAHALQVERLAMTLFSCLGSLHCMGVPERRLLCYASLLHDTGWSVPAMPHHKASMNLILSDLTIPVSDTDRRIIALIARYHRKAHPSSGHRVFCTLTRDHMQQVRWSAAILRVADALDRSHDSRVRSVSCQISERKIAIRCDTAGREIDGEENSIIMKKAALLEEVSGREIGVCLA